MSLLELRPGLLLAATSTKGHCDMSNAFKRYSLVTWCVVFAALCVAIGALVLSIDDSEGTFFLISLVGALLGFPSVWLVQEIVWGLEEYLTNGTSILYTSILGMGVLINWFLFGLAAQTIRNLRGRSKRASAPAA